MCRRRHQTISHDPAILSQVRDLFRVPFVLFHRCGITRELSDFAISHANAAMTMRVVRLSGYKQCMKHMRHVDKHISLHFGEIHVIPQVPNFQIFNRDTKTLGKRL